MHVKNGVDIELGSMMSVALQALVGEIQWLLAMLRANQGANSPHIKAILHYLDCIRYGSCGFMFIFMSISMVCVSRCY